MFVARYKEKTLQSVLDLDIPNPDELSDGEAVSTPTDMFTMKPLNRTIPFFGTNSSIASVPIAERSSNQPTTSTSNQPNPSASTDDNGGPPEKKKAKTVQQTTLTGLPPLVLNDDFFDTIDQKPDTYRMMVFPTITLLYYKLSKKLFHFILFRFINTSRTTAK